MSTFYSTVLADPKGGTGSTYFPPKHVEEFLPPFAVFEKHGRKGTVAEWAGG
jgi:hypothetical protein